MPGEKGGRQPQKSSDYNENHAPCLRFRFRYICWVTLIERAAAVLCDAETTLRRLLAEAVDRGDYESVVQLASWARSVAAMVKACPEPVTSRSSEPPTSGSAPADRLPVANARASRAGRKIARDEYPRFYRRDERLIRVAWSKRDKKEYEHRAPHAVLKTLIESIASNATGGRIFSTEEILPIHDNEGNLIPSYQAYVGIALLKQTGLVDQHGRKGYSVPRIADLRNAIEIVWQNLPAE